MSTCGCLSHGFEARPAHAAAQAIYDMFVFMYASLIPADRVGVRQANRGVMTQPVEAPLRVGTEQRGSVHVEDAAVRHHRGHLHRDTAH